MKKICVIGNFSGRNAGDAAILGGLLEDISTLYQNILFEIPTINTKFVKLHYAGYRIRPISLLPWNLSLKIFGLPIFQSVLRSDLVLVTDAILFDLHLLNPLFNYLSTMALVLPMAKKRRIPVILYNVSLGPVYSNLGKTCLRRVIDSAELILLRDTESIATMEQVSIGRDGIEMGADCALNVLPTQDETVDRILAAEGFDLSQDQMITLNVNSYLNIFLSKNRNRVAREEFTTVMAEAVDRIVEALKVRILFVVTQPMDLAITKLLMAKVRRPEGMSLISNLNYSYQDLAGVFSKAAVHVGMRTHSLILAASTYTPIVGIVATPKNRGFIRSIHQEERMIEFPDLTGPRLANLVITTYEKRRQIRKAMHPIMDREKQKARASAKKLAPFLT